MIFAVLSIILLTTQQITAVVNNPQSTNIENDANGSGSSSNSKTNEEQINNNSGISVSSSNSQIASDSIVAASSDNNEANRREAPLLQLSDSYGAPLSSGPADSYIPSGPSNPTLPIPVYGVPDSSNNHVIYPAPPPDIPPPLPAISTNFLTSLDTYGPPKPLNLPPSDNYLSPPVKYGPPPRPIINKLQFHGAKPPKHLYGPPPRPQYGPPKPHFISKQPKPNYGPPKLQYGPPKLHFPTKSGPSKPFRPLPSEPILAVPLKEHHYEPLKDFNRPAIDNNYGPPPKDFYELSIDNNYGRPPIKDFHHGPSIDNSNYRPPNDIHEHLNDNIYGPPNINYGSPQISLPQPHYGPPEPIPHGPPHPGAPAPPTPPDIKYDGWQPMPGLVSRPPSDSYGVPDKEKQHNIGDLHFNSDFTPPPVGSHNSISSSSIVLQSSAQSLSNTYGAPSDSYGAPLNAVTGSGGVISSSGDSHHNDHSLSVGLSAVGLGHSDQNHLSVTKSIGYELFPHANNGGGSHSSDSYSSPPLSSYSPNGPYAAAHSYKNNGLLSSYSSAGSSSLFNSQNHDLSLSTTGIGLIPPSGVYGVPPSGRYGTPLISKPNGNNNYLNALKINPPKHPVVFREPVPPGLIQSIGQNTAHKDLHNIIETSSNYNSGNTYIPPPVHEVGKSVRDDKPPFPSSLYSLPSSNSPVSFQNLALGSASHGLSSFNLNSNFGETGIHAAALTSYTAPLGAIDGSYGLPSVGHSFPTNPGLSVGLDNTHPPLTIDLTATSNIAQQNPYSYHHDCSLHKSQQQALVPSLSYGVPSANSYTESLSSLTTNIGGAYQGSSGLNYGNAVPDLHTAHSQTVRSGAAAAINTIETADDIAEKENYGKSLAANFGPDSELIKSQSIDLNNIPVQGQQGSYTLQIQSANGLSGSSQVPHSQVLNDGLLQSILAAIEQPQQQGANILGQPLISLQPPNLEQIQNYAPLLPSSPSAIGDDNQDDAEPQHSVKNAVVVPAPSPVTDVSATKSENSASTQQPETQTDASLHMLDNNEIALYFSNNSQEQQQTSDISSNVNDQQNNASSTKELAEIRNGQQYGTYVSYKTPTNSYVYGELKSVTDKAESTTGAN